MAPDWWKQETGGRRSDSDDSASRRRWDRRSFAEAISANLQAGLDSRSQICARLRSIESTLVVLSGNINSVSCVREQTKYVEMPWIVHVDVPKFHFVGVQKYLDCAAMAKTVSANEEEAEVPTVQFFDNVGHARQRTPKFSPFLASGSLLPVELGSR